MCSMIKKVLEIVSKNFRILFFDSRFTEVLNSNQSESNILSED